MVSIWPWARDTSSTASFEKTLSVLSKKIADSQAKLDRTRASSRRIKVLWTLYLSVAYLIYAIILLVVVGWKNLGSYEWTGMAGGPVLIYVVRTILATYYNFRIDSLSTRLRDQQSERTKTIQKLKDATKYDSTLQLLEKYGGSDPKPEKSNKKAGAPDVDGKQQAAGKPGHGTPGRTGIAPPPTANIQRPGVKTLPSAPTTPLGQSPFRPPLPLPTPGLEAGEEFAPNAFGRPPPPQFIQYEPQAPAPHWYDRILDLIVGEDEMASKNRIALICQQCRLVNGQAPPGTTRLAQVGRWKCMACGTLNGEELDEGKKVVKEILESKAKEPKDGAVHSEGELSAGEDVSVVKDTPE